MAEEGQVIGCHNVESWNENTQKGIDLKKLKVNETISGVKMGLWLCPALCRLEMPDAGGGSITVVVDFTASWCGPCRVMAPVLADIAKSMPHVNLPEDCCRGVEGRRMPTFIFLKEGKLVDKIVGANKDKLRAKIAEHATLTASA